VHSKARSRLSLTHLPVQLLIRVKSLDGPRVREISPVVKETVYGGKDLLKRTLCTTLWHWKNMLAMLKKPLNSLVVERQKAEIYHCI